MSVLTFTDVHKSFGAQQVLGGATFFVGQGQKVALVGANGSGKTTLLRLALGTEKADQGRVTLAPGLKVAALEQEPLVGDARTVLDAGQRPSLELQRAWSELLRTEEELHRDSSPAATEAHDNAHHLYQDLRGYECENRAREVLGGLGLGQDAWEKPVSVLSGGERTRLALAQILVLQPDLLLLDEPTNHVDWAACDWLEQHLSRYPGAALIVSHDRFFLDRVAEQVVNLEDGATSTYRGGYTDFVRKRELELRQDEERRQRQLMEIERQKAIIARLRSHRKYDAMHSREKQLARLGEPEGPARRAQALKVQARGAAAGDRTALTARNLSFAYGDRTLFSGLSFTLEAGDRLGVIGPNGVGKSTLLKIITGQLQPRSGEVNLGFRGEVGYFARTAPPFPKAPRSSKRWSPVETSPPSRSSRRWLATSFPRTSRRNRSSH